MGQLNGAIQEYHYIEHRGVPVWPWRNPIVHDDAWTVGEEADKPYLEQHTVVTDPRYQPLFVTGDAEWSDYAVEAQVRPLLRQENAGLVFRYHTSRHYYAFTLANGTTARLALRLPVDAAFRQSAWKELASTAFPYETTRYYQMRVETEGPRIRAYLDGKLLFEASDGEIPKGMAGVTANRPARFQDFAATAADSAARALRERIQAREAELARLRKENPRPKLWKKFDTPGFGAGRNVRFGDLNGDGRLDMLIAQQVPKVRGDAYDQISCLTAVTLDGRILWQLGRPNPKNGLLTNDTPFQIHDIDGDGKNEVVLIRDFQLQILEGGTGKPRKWAWMPPAVPNERQEQPHELTNGDSILFANLSGSSARREIVVKDRYRTFWVYDNNLRLLWSGQGQTGHYPFPIDVSGDGRDEFVIGYGLWTHAGKPLWSHDAAMRDHPDAISAGNFSGRAGGPLRVYICGSDEGFVVINKDGSIHRHIRLGHAQTQSVGKYRMDVPGQQILIANFWRNPGIVTLFDFDANILAQEEMTPGSTHLAPVNWRGDGQEFALLSANVRDGGMLDGQLRRVVMFPDDGHPDLAYYVADVTGDARDEVILWDQERVWIYTQDGPPLRPEVYRPRRNPHYNESNYRANVSLPQ
jgi:rhamnogalacturonan endolyase